MRLDKLDIELRPRPHAQALDLGFAVLRAHARDAYLSWLALWLPLIALAAGLAYLFPEGGNAWLLLPWWLKPMLERAPLYVLSRQVFGEAVTWRDALRAWPRQLGGGWFRLLTWGRPFSTGRGLYQPIWQLEGARGKAAAERRKVIGRNGTGRSALWFGVVCAHFEGILQLGVVAFIGVFLSDDSAINPFSYLAAFTEDQNSTLLIAITFACYALAGGIIGPIYVACCFTLYLNRRATLEAWDIEIMLRQIKPPAPKKTRTGSQATLALALCIPVLLAFSLTHPSEARAAAANTVPGPAAKSPSEQGKCAAPDWVVNPDTTRRPDQSAAQTQLRNELARLYDSDDLRVYVCEEKWVRKNPQEKEKPKERSDLPDLKLAAEIIKIVLIAAAICVVGWLLYRYRETFASLLSRPQAAAATEIGGLDIRAESLPDDVVGTVRRLWADGDRRAALALLYRASLSRLVHEDGLMLTEGATEGDCLRLARGAHLQQRLSAARLQAVAAATDFWLNGAYGDRWPEDDAVASACAAWEAAFQRAAGRNA